MGTFTELKVECGRTFSSEVKLDEAVVARWASNGRVPPADAIRDYRIDRLPGFNASRTDAAREAETLGLPRARFARRRNTPASRTRRQTAPAPA